METQVDTTSAVQSSTSPGSVPAKRLRPWWLVVVVGLIAATALGAGISAMKLIGRPADEGERREGPRNSVPVVLAAARSMDFENRVVISGSVQAKDFALVSARLPGVLDAVYVDEGDAVEAGKTRLFQTDSLKLTKAVAVARQGLVVAQCALDEARARRQQALADLEQAERDLQRYRELVQHNAVPVQLLEKHQTAHKQAMAAMQDVEALIALRQAQLEQAQLSLDMAEKDLSDSVVTAPISGRVSQRLKEPGEMAAPGEPVVKIEDLSLLEISVFLPAERYAQVVAGSTAMRVQVNGIDLGVRKVSYKSPTVDPKLRTFEARALVPDPPPGVAPGCAANVTVVLDQRAGIGVPSQSIVRRGGRSVVFVVEGHAARMVPVETGRETNGWTEILRGQVAPGTPVVRMGQQLIEDGTPVTVVEEAD